MLAGPPLTLHAWAQGGGGAGERGAATHQHLDSAFSYDRYYYDRGYAVHKPPAGGLTDLIGLRGERYYVQGGNWFRWRGDWYRCWGGGRLNDLLPLGRRLRATEARPLKTMPGDIGGWTLRSRRCTRHPAS